MTNLVLSAENGIRVSYPLESIKTIRHGKAREMYDVSDLNANGVRPNDSLVQIDFTDESRASFSDVWTLSFE